MITSTKTPSGKPTANKLNNDQRAELRRLAAEMRLKGATSKTIAECWNSQQVKAHQITNRTVRYLLKEGRDKALESANDDHQKLTRKIVARMAAIALFDPRSVIDLKSGKIKAKSARRLSAHEAAALGIKTKGTGSERIIEVEHHPAVQVKAGADLLRFMHGSKVLVSDPGKILELMMDLKDPEGLRRLAAGENAVDVMLDRYRELVQEESEPAD